MRFLGSSEALVSLVAKPNYRVLGPRFQKRTEEAAAAIKALGGDALAAYRDGEVVEIRLDGDTFPLAPGELEVVEAARGDLVVQGDGRFTAALDPSVSEDLRREGIARELVNRVQRLRKDADLEITDRISLWVAGPEEVVAAAEAFRGFIAGETLATAFSVSTEDQDLARCRIVREVDLEGITAQIGLSPAVGPSTGEPAQR